LEAGATCQQCHALTVAVSEKKAVVPKERPEETAAQTKARLEAEKLLSKAKLELAKHMRTDVHTRDAKFFSACELHEIKRYTVKADEVKHLQGHMAYLSLKDLCIFLKI
jgi:hypothetical protein